MTIAGSPSDQTLAAAIAQHQAGRLDEAERLYRAVCDADPQNARAFHLLGVVMHQLHRPDAAALLARAIALRPDVPEIHNDRGVILAGNGQFVEALACFEQALALRPGYLEARGNLARSLRSVGRFDEAVRQFEALLQQAPQALAIHLELAATLEAGGAVGPAEQQLRHALSVQPRLFEACVHLARLLQAQDRAAEALEFAERAATLRPDSAGALNNLGNVLRALGRPDQAIVQYDAALRIDPNFAMAHYNCGLALRSRAQIAQARAHFARAFTLQPQALEAELAWCMAELPPLYDTPAEIEQCRATYAERLAQLTADVERAGTPARLAEEIGAHQPFYLPYQGRNDRELQSRYGATVCKVMAARFEQPSLPHAPGPNEPIRIGIVSGFFRQHSNWKIPIKGWLKMLDRNRFRLFGYHTSTERDAETEAAEQLCSRFVQGPQRLDAWRQVILDDAPHVLIYPEIGMDTLSAQLGALRLATVQCCSWGHPVTSGFPTMDYFLSSELMEPAEAEAHYSERLVRLPNLSVYCEPAEKPPTTTNRAQLGLRENAVVYWCGQSLPKYLPQFDEMFARIAAAVPGCQFIFIAFAGGEVVTRRFQDRLERAFGAAGLRAADHCVFLPRLSPDLFTAAIGQCDVVLDSIGWSGCNSVLESLVHDLPIVTHAGEMMRGRHSTAILTMMGLPETVAETIEDYIEIAIRLGRDPMQRAELSSRIAASKHRVYRDMTCVTALETFLEQAVRGG